MMDVAAQPAAVEGGWWERAAGLAQPLGVWLYGFLVVALTAGSAGGYLPTTHGWTAVITLWLAAVTLMVRDRVEVSTPAVVLLGALAAFTAWMTLSAAFWSPSPTSAMHEVQRNLAYLGIVAAGLALTSRRLAPLLAGGVLAGVVLQCLYALGTRVLPDRLGAFDSEAFGYRLSLPITYWNGLGIFAVMGMLLALGFAARARSTGARAAAAAALPLLATANYFTFSRGAWIALAVGLVVALVIDARRLQLIACVLVLAPWTVVAVHAASNREALTTRDATLAAATDEGHSLLPLLLALACASGAAAAAFAFAERRIEIPRAVRAAFAAVVAAALLGGAALFTERHGPPWEVADRMWTSFTGAPTKTGPDLSERIFQLSNNGRLDLWTTSWESFEHDRALGSGAGTFWQQWAANGDRRFNTTEGHSLYAETLGELGIPGLVLVVLLVAMPLVAGVRARRTAFVPAVTGAFAAWVAHAGVDWDWELVGVTGVALLCGTALVSA
ncbi:MAG: O-antigen ligase family protein, partial [Gaiellaceae bacterium]